MQHRSPPNPNEVEIRNRVLCTLLFAAGQRPTRSFVKRDSAVSTATGRARSRITFVFERNETLELVMASTSEKELEFLAKFAAALQFVDHARNRALELASGAAR
jgi:hypothetical protein